MDKDVTCELCHDSAVSDELKKDDRGSFIIAVCESNAKDAAQLYQNTRFVVEGFAVDARKALRSPELASFLSKMRKTGNS